MGVGVVGMHTWPDWGRARLSGPHLAVINQHTRGKFCAHLAAGTLACFCKGNARPIMYSFNKWLKVNWLFLYGIYWALYMLDEKLLGVMLCWSWKDIVPHTYPKLLVTHQGWIPPFPWDCRVEVEVVVVVVAVGDSSPPLLPLKHHWSQPSLMAVHPCAAPLSCSTLGGAEWARGCTTAQSAGWHQGAHQVVINNCVFYSVWPHKAYKLSAIMVVTEASTVHPIVTNTAQPDTTLRTPPPGFTAPAHRPTLAEKNGTEN